MNCRNCGAPKPHRWKRCSYCTNQPRKYRRGADPERVQAFKARVLGMRTAMKSSLERDAALDAADTARRHAHDATSRLAAAELELGRLLDHWVGWPPQTRAVRRLPPVLRIMVAPRMQAADFDPSRPLNTLVDMPPARELYQLRCWLEDARPDYPRHMLLRAHDERPPGFVVAYYLDDLARADGPYAVRHAVEDMLHKLQRERTP